MLSVEGTVSKGVRAMQMNFASGKVSFKDCTMGLNIGFFEKKNFIGPENIEMILHAALVETHDASAVRRINLLVKKEIRQKQLGIRQ